MTNPLMKLWNKIRPTNEAGESYPTCPVPDPDDKDTDARIEELDEVKREVERTLTGLNQYVRLSREVRSEHFPRHHMD